MLIVLDYMAADEKGIDGEFFGIFSDEQFVRYRKTVLDAALAFLVALGGFPLVRAEVPEECRRQCSLDLEACSNGCIDSRDFDGCLTECHSVEEDCLSGCR